MGGLGDWANFVFWVNFSKIFKHRVQGFYHQVHWLKKPMLAYGKNKPRNNQFYGFFLSRKSKILPKIKICPISLKIYPKTQNLPSHRVPPNDSCILSSKLRVRIYPKAAEESVAAKPIRGRQTYNSAIFSWKLHEVSDASPKSGFKTDCFFSFLNESAWGICIFYLWINICGGISRNHTINF